MGKKAKNTGTDARFNRTAWLLAWMLLAATIAAGQVASGGFDELAAKASEARKQHDVPGAIALYQQALQQKPDWIEGWWTLGTLEYESGAYALARDALTHVIDASPQAAPALAVRGLCEFNTGDYEPSLNDIRQALALRVAAPHSHEEIVLRFHKAMLLTHAGDFEGALGEYTGLAKEQINDPDILLGAGLAGLRSSMLPSQVPTDQRDLFLSAGTAAFRVMQGETQKGAEEFNQLFARYPKTADLHYFYGYLLFGTDPDEALPEFQRELEVSGANAADEVMLAWYFLLRNRASEALPYAEKAAAGAPDSPTAQLVCGRALVETGQMTEGLKHLETAVKLAPGNLEIHLALVKAYSESGRKEEASRERRQCLEMTKENASAVVHP